MVLPTPKVNLSISALLPAWQLLLTLGTTMYWKPWWTTIQWACGNANLAKNQRIHTPCILGKYISSGTGFQLSTVWNNINVSLYVYTCIHVIHIYIYISRLPSSTLTYFTSPAFLPGAVSFRRWISTFGARRTTGSWRWGSLGTWIYVNCAHQISSILDRGVKMIKMFPQNHHPKKTS